MFLESFRITGVAVGQIFLLAAMGYFLVKRNFLGPESLNSLSRLVMEVTLPLLIFCQLVKEFTFQAYSNWWVFPLISIAITCVGLFVGALGLGFIKGLQQKTQFVSLIAFQNSGYLPLAFIAALLPADKTGTLFIYLFLFLIGFNLVLFSLGVHLLCFHKERKFELLSLFNPPVVATLASLVVVFFGLQKLVPDALLKPLRMAGDCTLPLAMFVVGGNLAQIKLSRVDVKPVFLVVILKMIFMPLFGLWVLAYLKPPELIGLLIIIQLAMPSAANLSVIVSYYKREDFYINQGIFFTHVISVITIPVFLSLYYMFFMLK